MSDLIRKSDAIQTVFDWEQGKISGTIADAIAAIPARGLGVRPLVWEDFEGLGAKASAYYQANYLIQFWKGQEQFEVALSYPGYQTGFDGERWHPTLEAAKAAAQADYEARILSALEPVAAPVTQEAIAEAEKRGYDRGFANALTGGASAPDALHRSFPEAGDGRPMPPMGDELMTAGLDAEDARFVAVQLAQNGWMLTPNPVDASQPADPAVNADVCTDCGGTGITYQTEQRCACQPATDPAAIREAALRDVLDILESHGAAGEAIADEVLAIIAKGAADDRA